MEADESMAVAVPGGSPMAASSSSSVDDQLYHQWCAVNDAYTCTLVLVLPKAVLTHCVLKKSGEKKNNLHLGILEWYISEVYQYAIGVCYGSVVY